MTTYYTDPTPDPLVWLEREIDKRRKRGDRSWENLQAVHSEVTDLRSYMRHIRAYSAKVREESKLLTSTIRKLRDPITSKTEPEAKGTGERSSPGRR